MDKSSPLIIKEYFEAVDTLKGGAVGVVPADTIYGLSCVANSKESVERIYDLKGREGSKPFIVLVSSYNDLENFGIRLTSNQKEVLAPYWPGPNSIIFPVNLEKYFYLHRGAGSLALRMPKHNELIELVEKTGPLVSTSANRAGNSPVKGVQQAFEIFGTGVDFYLDKGVLDAPPSNIYSLEGDSLSRLR